jgi:lipopolysaccharide export system permease protein
MLIMQFFWKYIDDLMGKGIGVGVIIELLFFVSASLIPLALPLAMLLSSIMTIGNLAENNELTALKSSGLSLYRILRPLTGVVLLICLGTFYFANFVIPVANLKWRTIIYDIQETKISTILTPGKYNNQLDGYSIKIDKGNDSKFEGITIHDHTNLNVVKTVKAERGEVFKSKNGLYLFFNLENGEVFEELSSFSGTGSGTNSNFHPSRRYSFDDATYKIDISGFKMNKSDEDLFKDKHEMYNVFQINQAVDSIQKQTFAILNNFVEGIKNSHPYFQAHKFKHDSISLRVIANMKIPNETININQISTPDLRQAYNISISKIRTTKENLQSQKLFTETIMDEVSKFYIEFNRKFALTATILVLFFVGAPLGAIVKKGGFGAPVVIAALLFMVYFILISVGESLANEGVLSPFWGMWMATFILAPVAIILMRSAANDSKVFNKESWSKLLKNKTKKTVQNESTSSHK